MTRRDTGPLALALDVGTTGVRALAVDETGTPRAHAYREVLPAYPAPGLVEHDTEATWAAAVTAIGTVVATVGSARVRGLGITSQRATAVVWDAASGRALHPALSWQDGRTRERCDELLTRGIFLVPLMAASKIEWILDRVDADRAGVRSGRLRCGTFESWFAARLSGGRIFATDHSCAASSGFYDMHSPQWDGRVLEALRVPQGALPALVDSSGVLGTVGGMDGLPELKLAALIGDQQSAMMGQLRTERGEIKITYGTAAMLDMHTGSEPDWATQGAYPLVLWKRDAQIEYCLEGTAITAGAAITWLRDGLGVIDSPADSEALAASVDDTGGVWAIPSFQGLGTPYLDTAARALIGGLSRASTRAHVVRAVLEGIAWRCREAYDALRAGSDTPAPAALRVDGGAAGNDVLLQAQADALGIAIERPGTLDAAALGAAYLAGLATGVWQDVSELRASWRAERVFEPRLSDDEREGRFAAWRRHVEAARHEGSLES